MLVVVPADLSPTPGPCDWSKDAAVRNGSSGLYQQYKSYVDGLPAVAAAAA